MYNEYITVCPYNLNDLLVTISIYMVDNEAMELFQLGISRQDVLI